MSSYFIEKPKEVLGRVKSLHKFQKLTKNSRRALAENYLWFSALSSFNDPFEGMVTYVPIDSPDLIFSNNFMYGFNLPSEEEIRLREMHYKDERAFYTKYEKEYREWYENWAEGLRNKGYYCFFSTLKDGDPKSAEDDILMWGHYTDGMRGYRINFDPEILAEGIGDDIDAYFIEYVDKPAPVQLDQLYQDMERSMSAGRFRVVHEERMFQSKSAHWDYEAELRFRKDEPGPWVCPVDSVRSVDFGYKMTGRQIAEVQRLVKKNNPAVRFYRALPSKTKFKVDLIPCADMSGI